VLIYDIETRPMTALCWGAREQNISPEQVLDPGGVLCWAAKWLDSPKVYYAGDHHDGHDAMVAQLWELLDAGDRAEPTVMHQVVPRLLGTPGSIRRAAPQRGQHTEELLQELGASPDECASLRQQGSIECN
jgi:hypothetical protein